jgi:hypothetical protein
MNALAWMIKAIKILCLAHTIVFRAATGNDSRAESLVKN